MNRTLVPGYPIIIRRLCPVISVISPVRRKISMLLSLMVSLLGYAPIPGLGPRSTAAKDRVGLAVRMEDQPYGYGASHTSFYTDAIAKDSYDTLEQVCVCDAQHLAVYLGSGAS